MATVALVLSVLVTAPGYAQVKPGDMIGAGASRLRRVNESILSSSTTAGGTSAHAWDPDH